MKRTFAAVNTSTLRSLFCLIFMFTSPFLPQSRAAEVSLEGYPRLMQGPMVGAVSDHEVRIWARASGEYPVSVEYGTTFDLASFRATEPVLARKDDDYTVVITIGDLEPETDYFYRIKVNGAPDRYLRDFPPFEVRTAPRPGASRDFRIAFGSCPRIQEDRLQPIWSTVLAHEPALFFWVGDNIYGDSLYPHVLQEEYRRQRDVDGLQPLLRSVPNLAIWDDHDYGLNNQDKGNPVKEPALEIFKRYWANPAYGLPETPGVFFRYSYGRVDFFFLDGRYYRDPDNAPDTPQKTMLGEAQLTWFESELQASTAVFKVIVAGSGWSKAKGPGGDSWASFLNERNGIFDFIRNHEISGVVLLSGDSHVGELNVIPWSEKGGYDFYDLVSSPLAQDPPDSWLERRPERRIRPVYFQGSSFGLVDFLFDPTPRLVFRVIDVQGRSVWKPFELRADELVNGVQSWPSKVSEEERFRQANYDEGKGYYEEVPPD
jgi:alkaline phosphatase D